MPNSTVLRWRVCCRGQPPFRTCPCLFVSVFVLVRQGHCGKCEPECHVEVHFGAVRLVETRRLRVWRTVSCIAPAWLRRRYRRSLPRIFFYGWGTSDNFLSTWPVFVWSDVYTPFSCSSSIIFFVREVLSFFFFFSHWSLSSIQKYKTRSSLAVCGCFHTTSAPDMAAVVYFSPWAYKLFFPCRPFWQWEFPPTTPSAWLIFFKLFLQCFLQTTTPLRYVLGCFKSLFQVFWQWLRVICVSGWV